MHQFIRGAGRPAGTALAVAALLGGTGTADAAGLTRGGGALVEGAARTAHGMTGRGEFAPAAVRGISGVGRAGHALCARRAPAM